jgi:hypothetical protein
MSVNYAEIEKALRKNGIAVMRKGNRDKISMGRDGKTLVIYGNIIYSPARDQEYLSDNEWINKVVRSVKNRCKQPDMVEMPKSAGGVKKSHHGKNEKTTGHHKQSMLGGNIREPGSHHAKK